MVKIKKVSEIIVFEAGKENISEYRIPSIACTAHGTLLSFAEGRTGKSDFAASSLVLKRSEDKGKTWGTQIEIYTDEKEAVHNAVPIVDHIQSTQKTSIIHLTYCVGYRKCYYIRSNDDGKSFSSPKEITAVFDDYKGIYTPRAIATGCGHGIQIQNQSSENRGRLLIPVWFAKIRKLHHPSRTATIYSDDFGKTWKAGEIIPYNRLRNPNEAQAVELPDGKILCLVRHESTKKTQNARKAISFSQSGINGWTPLERHPELLESVCYASIDKLQFEGHSYLIFSNPNSIQGKPVPYVNMRPRKNLTVKLSPDNGNTWPSELLIKKGFAGYSDITVDSDQNAYVLFEHGYVGEEEDKISTINHQHRYISVIKIQITN